MFTVLGIRALDFVSDSGERIIGTQLFCAFSEPGVNGQVVDKFFVRPDVKLPDKLTPGVIINIHFNRKGKVDAVVLG